MTNSLYEMSQQGMRVVVFVILDCMFVLANAIAMHVSLQARLIDEMVLILKIYRRCFFKFECNTELWCFSIFIPQDSEGYTAMHHSTYG